MPSDLLRRHPLLALLPPADLDAWLALGVERACQAGDLFCAAGSPGAFAFLLLGGGVRVVRTSRFRGEVTLGKLIPGQLFGEYALVPPYHNTATCRAASPSRLLQLPLDPLREALGPLPGVSPSLKSWVRLNALASHLRGQSFLGFHAADAVAAWDAALVERVYEPGMTIQAPGLADDRWFFLDHGEILHRDGAGGTNTRRLRPGDCFGERALAGLTGLAFAESVTVVRCRTLPRALFLGRETAGGSLQTVVPRCEHATLAGLWVAQQHPAECGLAALAMILRHRGRASSLADLRPLARLSSGGLNFAQLSRVAAALGLGGTPVRVALDGLRDVALPAIAHFRDGHFVVVFECSPTTIIVGDPACGVRSLAWATWRERFSGHVLLFCPPVVPPAPDPATASRSGDLPVGGDRELWNRFHRLVEALDPEERQVVSLAVYHGLTHAQVAGHLGVDERTVRRHWRRAAPRLAEALGGLLPRL